MPQKSLLKIALLFTLSLLMACTPTDTPTTTGSFQPITGRDLRIVTGQTVYVPAYSEVLVGGRGLTHELTVTLAVHNTDIDASIILQSVRYYDTDGNVVRDYVEDPIEVTSLATTGFLAEDRDSSGGWGSNFVVEWVAEEPVSEPIIEAIMISTSGTQGISMISLGRVISQTDAEADTPADTDSTEE
ncbi:MAG: DUF3124 domain-containing protein [Chloroflexota bacterium]